MTEERQHEEREIQALLIGAGPRPEVPASDLAVIREAARGEWRRLVAAESRNREGRVGRRTLALAATLAVALVAGWWWLVNRSPVTAEPAARVEVALGSLHGHTAAPRDLDDPVPAAGSSLFAGATVETGSAGAALRLARGQSLRLDADTRIRLASSRRIELERGAVYLDSGLDTGKAGDDSEAGGVEIATPFGSVRDVGTQFEVRLGTAVEGLAVRVREGRVVVGGDGRSYSASGGQAVIVRADGSVLEERIEPFGESWRWVVETAPALEIEGRSLVSFLGWVCRETGWRLRYQDETLAETAESVVLHGSIEGLTPVEALDLVLPGSNLDYEAGGGELWIRTRN